MKSYRQVFAILFVASTCVSAAEDLNTKIDVELNSVPLERALKKVFWVRASFILMPEVKSANVSANFTETPAIKVLDSVLAQAKAAYVKVNGIYYIVPAGAAKASASSPPTPRSKPARMTYQFLDEDVHRSVRALCDAAGRKFKISPDVKGLVSTGCLRMPFHDCLDNIVISANATFTVENGDLHHRSQELGRMMSKRRVSVVLAVVILITCVASSSSYKSLQNACSGRCRG